MAKAGTYKQDDTIFDAEGPEIIDPDGDVSNDERSAIFKYVVKRASAWKATHQADGVCLAVDISKFPARVTLSGAEDSTGAKTQPPVFPDPNPAQPIPDLSWRVLTAGKDMKWTYKEKAAPNTPYRGEIVEKNGKYFRADDETVELECTPPQDETFYIKVRTGYFANRDMDDKDEDGKNVAYSATKGLEAEIPIRIECRFKKVVKENTVTFDQEDDLTFTITD